MFVNVVGGFFTLKTTHISDVTLIGYVFCLLHRLPEQHHCSYDHKESGREKDLQKMVPAKRHIGRSFHRLDSTPDN